MIPHYYVEKRNDTFVLTNSGRVVVSSKDISSFVAGVSELRDMSRKSGIAVYCGAVEDRAIMEQQESLSPEENKEFWRLYNLTLC